ncbi:MAG: thioredoxin family protein [Tateyamaria sp.]
MHRRTFVLSATACAMPVSAFGYSAQIYTPAVWRDLRETDMTVVMNFRASWSLTCQIKADLIAEALAENPAYGSLTFLDVDWDTFGPSQMTQKLNVKRRSTLLVMKGGTEITRLVNEPYARKVRALLDQALAA